MKRVLPLLLVSVCAHPWLTAPSLAQTTQPTRFPHTPIVKYPLGPDSRRKEGVPQGKVTKFDWKDSKVFPGTVRHCAVYVPAQYDPAKSAALMVFQDGTGYANPNGDYRVPVVFDNLIASHEMPVTIAVFVDPGFKHPDFPTEKGARPENRSFEYDTLSDDYAQLLLTEILPHVKAEYHLNITDDPDGRAICGASSGAICAFTVAFNHPESFRKVVSHVGSFTNIRGGDKYPSIIKSSPWKPLRVFLQDGSNDNRADPRYRRPDFNWVIANHLMAAALEEKDYDYKYVYGDGPHSGNHGGAILPDTLRWLWRDYNPKS